MFFFSSRRRHTRCSRDWSSDVCSSDLLRCCGGVSDLGYEDRQRIAKPFMDVTKFLDEIIAWFIGTKHERDIKKLQPVIAAINASEPEMQSLRNEELKTRYAELRKQVQERDRKSTRLNSSHGYIS